MFNILFRTFYWLCVLKFSRALSTGYSIPTLAAREIKDSLRLSLVVSVVFQRWSWTASACLRSCSVRFVGIAGDWYYQFSRIIWREALSNYSRGHLSTITYGLLTLCEVKMAGIGQVQHTWYVSRVVRLYSCTVSVSLIQFDFYMLK